MEYDALTIIKLIAATLLPVILSVTLYFAEKKTRFGKVNYWARQAVIGVLFGGVAVLATAFGIPIEGAVLNVRNAAPLTAGLLFGGPAGIIAGVIGGVYRWFATYFGAGEFSQVACTIGCVLAGFFGAGCRKFMFDNKKASWFYGFVIGGTTEVLHMLLVFITNMNDVYGAYRVVAVCAVPMILCNAVSVMLSLFLVALIGKERIRKPMKNRQISQIFQFLLLICVVLAFAVTTIFTSSLQTRIAYANADSLLELNLNDVQKDLQRAETADDIRNAVVNRHIGKEGGIIVCDNNGRIVYDNGKHTGESIYTFEEANKIQATPGIRFTANIGDTKSFCMFSMAENLYIIAYLPISEAMFSRNIVALLLHFERYNCHIIISIFNCSEGINMEQTSKHNLLNSVLFTALAIPVIFFILRDLIAILLGLLIEMTAGQASFLYAINDDIARLAIAGLLMLVMPLYFRGSCSFGLKDGSLKLGLCLALPELIVPLWNLLQIAVYKAPLVTGTSAVIAAIVHGIGPGVSEEIFCRGFVVSNLMRIRKDKPHRVLDCVLISGISFGLLHMTNILATKEIWATLIQVLYTAAIGVFSGAVYVRTRSLWGVMLMHTLTDITAFIAVFDSEATGMDLAFLAFGSILFLALALFLIRPSKQEEICALWEDGWSFGAETGKNRAGAKTAGIVSAVIAGLLVLGVGVMIYRAKMGYDLPFFPSADIAPDADISYEIGSDGRQLTISLPCDSGNTYTVENSASDRLLLQESGRIGDKYRLVFRLEGNGTEPIRLKFSLYIGEMPVSMKDYSVTVKFDEKGNVSDVRG